MTPSQMRLSLALGLLLGVAGCTEHWTRPGSDQSDFARVKEICDARGDSVYPPKMEVVLTGASGGCSGMQRNCPPVTLTTMTVDSNQDARAKESRICLQQNGWTETK